MNNSGPSSTAQATALYRAIESLRPEKERVCSDPMARRFLQGPVKLAAGSRFLSGKILEKFEKQGLSTAYGFPVARTPVIDDFLFESLNQGAEQLVIMGAGFDSRAYRFKELADNIKVFEIDDPPTQSVKTAKINKILGSAPPHVSYIPLRLGEDNLSKSLLKSGYGPNIKTVFICEGVTMYMTPEAVDEMFIFMKDESGPGSRVVFDYAFDAAVKGTGDSEEALKWLAFLKNLGEPPLFGIDEGGAGEFLSEKAFELIENLCGTELEERYFKAKGRDQKVSSFLAIATAQKI
ncbi:MAG: class I SAM-dependent methyltransferase [Actinobacteria bacterium]|nr:class I SAM-dependent methyltransferase [Actinomycetota bacterium]